MVGGARLGDERERRHAVLKTGVKWVGARHDHEDLVSNIKVRSFGGVVSPHQRGGYPSHLARRVVQG